jgi:hypothetical protein
VAKFWAFAVVQLGSKKLLLWVGSHAAILNVLLFALHVFVF